MTQWLAKSTYLLTAPPSDDQRIGLDTSLSIQGGSFLVTDSRLEVELLMRSAHIATLADAISIARYLTRRAIRINGMPVSVEASITVGLVDASITPAMSA